MKKSLLVVFMVMLLVVTGCGKDKKDYKKELTDNLEKLGRTFYEEFYYPHQIENNEDIASFLVKFKESGVKANLENISKISVVDKALVDSMVNNETKEKCDFKNSSVTFYPKEPYGKTDYEVKVELECGYEEK